MKHFFLPVSLFVYVYMACITLVSVPVVGSYGGCCAQVYGQAFMSWEDLELDYI